MIQRNLIFQYYYYSYYYSYFGIEKCAMLIMKSGKRHMTEGMELPNQEKIRTLEEKKTYERKFFKSVSQENEKATRNKTI